MPLPELAPADREAPEYTFRLLPVQERSFSRYRWFHHHRLLSGQIWLSLAKTERGYLLRFPNLADFRVSADGKAVECASRPGTTLETVRHLFLDQVFPMLLSHGGSLTLHASAVASPMGAIVFLGMSGRGKSTLSGSFCRQGFPLLADDCLRIDRTEAGLYAVPSYPGLRLWLDTVTALFEQEPTLSRVAHNSDKKRLALKHGRLPFAAGPVPLLKAYILAPPEDEAAGPITIAPLPSRDALIELVRYGYRLDLTDHQRLREEFDILGRVAASLPIALLTFPRDLAFLPAVREAIVADARGHNMFGQT